MLKLRMSWAVIIPTCGLVSILCLWAHLHVEFKGHVLRSWTTFASVKQTQKDAKVQHISEAIPIMHCPTANPIRKWKIELQPWAGENHSLEEEALRFITYITTPQIFCENPKSPELQDNIQTQRTWPLCLDNRFNLVGRINSKRCRVYSLGLGGDDKTLEKVLANAGCEVHCFDPSIREAHLQDARMWLHRLSVDWRDPNPAMSQRLHSGTKKLAVILNQFGHRQVDILKLDMESAEWKIIENLILDGVLHSVGLLLLEVHLHWAGFEVSGDEADVVRYWFSLMRELERTHFRLYHSHSKDTKPRLFLQKQLHNASSSYVLGWVNMCYSPQ